MSVININLTLLIGDNYVNERLTTNVKKDRSGRQGNVHYHN